MGQELGSGAVAQGLGSGAMCAGAGLSLGLDEAKALQVLNVLWVQWLLSPKPTARSHLEPRLDTCTPRCSLTWPT